MSHGSTIGPEITRATLILLGFLALTSPPAYSQRDASATLVAAARAVGREMSAIRELPWQGPVDFQVSDRSTIRQFARDAMSREMTPQQWEDFESLLLHCGLIPEGTDLHQLVERLYVEQVAGYYDPHRETFYLADWLPELMQRGVVAHETTHALQDQHFDLEMWLSAVPPTEDGSIVRAAIAEGDAMSAMLAYLLAPTGVDVRSLPDVAGLMEGNSAAIAQAYPAFDQAPKALQRLLLFPYVEGSRFVLRVLREGGWGAVDELYEDPPASTEQILHPELYLETRDDPVPLEIPGGPEGSDLLVAGSWGEFGTSLLLEATLGDTLVSRRASRGWDGDRYAIYRRRDGRLAYAWVSVWDSPTAAEQFAETYAQATVKRFPGSARVATRADGFSFDGPGRSLDLRRRDFSVEIRENF